MYAVEFQTTVQEDGRIAIPSSYRPQLRGTIRVIILTATPPVKPSILQHLLAHPRPVPAFTPLSRDEVYDRNL